VTKTIDENRRKFLTGATTVIGLAGVTAAAVPFIGSWQPSARAKTLGAPVEFDISKLVVGALVTVEWRGKPVFILKRSASEMQKLTQVRSLLSDPDSNIAEQPKYVQTDTRSIVGHESILVIVGLCTHLGCVPKFRPDVGAADLGGSSWPGGFFCPCHGSKFDLSGRVFNGAPAPSNLTVPPYRYESDKVITIGLEQTS